MLTEYIRAAMREARYEMMEDGRFFAVIPPCAGLWADGDTLEGAREQLQEVLEDWILIKARHEDAFPVIGGVDINSTPSQPHGTLGDFLSLWRRNPEDAKFAYDLERANSRELPSPNPLGL